jgi:site-specific recombinase XerD
MKFLSENTQRAYKSDLQTFLAIVNKEIQKTTMKDLHYYFSELENRNYRNSTINRKINSLSKIFTIYEKT